MFNTKLVPACYLQQYRSANLLLAFIIHFIRAELCLRIFAFFRYSEKMAVTSWQWVLAAFEVYDSAEMEDEGLFSSRSDSAEWGLSTGSNSPAKVEKRPSSKRSQGARGAKFPTCEMRDVTHGGCIGRPTRRGSFSQLTPTEEVIMNFLERSSLDNDATSKADDPAAMFPQCIWPLIAYQQTMVAAFWIRIFRFLLPSKKSIVEERVQPEDAEQPTKQEEEVPVVSSSTDVNSDCLVWSAPRDADNFPAEVEDTSAAHYLNVPQLAPLSPSDAPFDTSKLLPPPRPIHANRKTLVLDLDETLIHSVFTPIINADFVIDLDVDGKLTTIYVHKRPGVEEFLRAVAQVYEVVVFTASMASYANALVNLLDPEGTLVHHRLFRDSCVWWRNSYVKDLSMLGRDLATTMIVDNSPLSYAFQPENGIPILSYYDEQGDRELSKLAPFLVKLASVEDDVRMHLGGLGSVTIG
eukprot:TRINITY_DN26819_c0_g1_i1.p1 TRINITY_DN26819_c0_g1~~TRINITY_DN26819_c0_g1_i1.p1  ORF type:complete len:466 (-),score=15.29 TRINITY_DN26819_c0_g1_i1:407-1804(-)